VGGSLRSASTLHVTSRPSCRPSDGTALRQRILRATGAAREGSAFRLTAPTSSTSTFPEPGTENGATYASTGSCNRNPRSAATTSPCRKGFEDHVLLDARVTTASHSPPAGFLLGTRLSKPRGSAVT